MATSIHVLIRFRDGGKVDLHGILSAGVENGCYNLVVGTSPETLTSIRRYPLDIIFSIEEELVEDAPKAASMLLVPKPIVR